MVEREGLPEHAADRQADVMDARDRQRVEHVRDIAGEVVHRVVLARRRIAAAMTAHVDTQDAEAGLQQCRHLLGPTAAVRGERMGDADSRRALGPDQVVMDVASLQWQQHGPSSVSGLGAA
jgi:hypothetical protein